MTTKHTPGPWNYKLSPNPRNFFMIGPDGFVSVAVIPDGHHADEAEANARLIAAATELLDALNEQDRFLGVLSGTVPLSEKDTHRRIQINREAVRAAIAKATGSGE